MKRKTAKATGRKGKRTAGPKPAPRRKPTPRPKPVPRPQRGPRPEAIRYSRERLAVKVGEILERRRVAAGVTRVALAEWCFLTEMGVYNIERKGVPDSGIRMALALGCPFSELYAEAERELMEEDRLQAEQVRAALRVSLGLVSRENTLRG